MKLESPEIAGLVRNVLMRWDPLLLVDCHTTDGSYHQEPVTYSWPLCPNGDPAVLKYARDKMLPAVDATLEKKYGTLGLPYGDPRTSGTWSKGWQTFGHQPRYMTNYVGLRNRLSILDRELQLRRLQDPRRRQLPHAPGHPRLLLRPTPPSSRSSSPTPTPGRSRPGSPPPETDTFGLDIEVQAAPQPDHRPGYEMEASGRPPRAPPGPFPRMRPTDRKKTYIMPYYADFVAKRSVRLPSAYLIPLAGTEVLDKLRQHGIAVERLTEAVTLEVGGLPAQGDQGGRAPLPGPPDQHGQGRVRRREAGVPQGDARSSGRPSPWAAWPPTCSSRRATTACSSGIFSTGTSSASGAAGRRPTRSTSC